jgi:MinD-like ATPase involved in chromosome partitioning or flagellar assembly
MTIFQLPTEPEIALAESSVSECKVISVWGTSGSGKSTISLNLAFELASLGHAVLLVDGDSYSPSLSAALGVLKPSGGVLAALRLARQARLDSGELERLSEELNFGTRSLRFLAGVVSPLRWAEFDAAEELLKIARESFDFVVVDLASSLEPGIYGPESATPRNQSTVGVIGASDVVLGIFSADPVGVNRFLWDIRQASFDFWAVANRVRQSALGHNPERQLKDAIYSLAKKELTYLLPDDPQSVDLALLKGQPLIASAQKSKLREAIRRLAIDVSSERTKLQNREHRGD